MVEFFNHGNFPFGMWGCVFSFEEATAVDSVTKPQKMDILIH
ncbi:hypothetical protein AJ81_02280 [Pseudothermotoga hypogea DSM 11164 = NBRC 106472]|uniref:Uncharacterized protein n=1 Tax=Pseudothermotoga hypogea DSM 11164 = NBRC 106472 TaxID=1123384 RepID=A0A0X1KTK6_9THEM|nr:hypothetical protein AJ81_02280 [Pseudothermotoga hypogea DSM 11164 = NBRC 106472]